jgi:N-methylhydantoinase B
VKQPLADLPLDVLWPRLIAIADEMATTLFRTAFSHDVIEVHDMSTGLYDDRGNLVAQTFLGATGHTGVMPVFGKNLVAAFPPDTVRPGDVFVCNDPWLCNGQTADVFVTTPAFVGDRLIGFSVNSVHHVDIGGRKGSGLSEEVFEEGLILPPLRLYRAGVPNDDLFALLRRNVRFSEKMLGDVRAQIAAGWIGARGLERLAREFELASLGPVADEIFRRTEAGMRAGIARLPDGRYTRRMSMEIAGLDEPQTIALTVTIDGDRLIADFTGTSPQVRRPVNSPINYTRAYVAVPVKMVCDPEWPNNEGTYRPLAVTAPDGCLVNPSYPAACFWRLAAGMLVSELMFRILAEIAPDRVPADSGSMPTWQFYVNGTKRSGEAFALHQHAFGGMGGRPGIDGLASVSFPYNVRDVSVEWAELETPILFERRELIADSGGAGRFRGGLGEELTMRAFDDGRLDPGAPIVLSGSAGRMRFPPEGLFGGRAGSRGAILVNEAPVAPTSSPEITFRAGDVVRLLLPGGGGYGDPRERARALVEADLRHGYVTDEGALRDYGGDGGSSPASRSR